MAKKPELRDVYRDRDVKTGQFVTERERRPTSGRVLAHDGRRVREDAEAVYGVASSGRIRRVQEAFKKARKGEGIFGLKNAK
jgi:hypothetical protein